MQCTHRAGTTHSEFRVVCRQSGSNPVLATSGLGVIRPQLAKTSRMTCESISMRGLAIVRQPDLRFSQILDKHEMVDSTGPVGGPFPLDTLPETNVCSHLECLPRTKSALNFCKVLWTCWVSRHLLEVAGPAHGHAIAKTIESSIRPTCCRLSRGSLYPALHRLIRHGWISSEEGTSENNRRGKFYRLTTKGRRQLTIETSNGNKLIAEAIAPILRPAGTGEVNREHA